jgi:hypothetical protein
VNGWRRDPQVLWRRCDDRIVLLAPDRDDVLVLEGTGRLIWELLELPTPHDELVAALAEAFDRPQDEVDTEVTAFAAELRTAGALVTT